MIGTLFQNRYRLDGEIGRGGMGVVYRAYDTLLDRVIAVKVLAVSQMEREVHERLLHEARSTARLNHPNIVSVYDVGKSDGHSFIVMEFVDGVPLQNYRPLSVPQVISLARQICAALEHAHAHGVIHRDLKPENVLVGANGSVKLMDFGLAITALSARPSSEGRIAGTVYYLAPEQAIGGPVDARADLYSLGVMLYELIAGRLPFTGDEPLAIISQHIHAIVVSPKEYRPELPDALEAIVLKLLAKSPEERFGSAAELWQALADVSPPGGEGVASAPMNNLPLAWSSFIGREREMAAVRRLLESSRLVTLTGAGGSGKTRLALQIARDLLERFPDGAWLVELSAVAESGRLPQAIASVLGVRELPSRSLEESLVDFLQHRRALLLLDNCEHLVGACAQLVDRLLSSCLNVSILVTSREALGITGETAFTVPTLSAPEPAQLAAASTRPGASLVAALGEYEAVQLFVERAAAVQPGFQLYGQNALAIAQICRRLDGIPLAIELAAARLRALSVEQIAARLDDRFSLLTLGSRTALPRQQTLRATFDWGHELLPPTERQLFARLAVFVEGWTLEAAEAVCAGEGLPASQVLDVLTSLVGKSLVLMDSTAGSVRYRFLETIRQYALEKLSASGELPRLERRFLDYFLGFSEEAWPRLRTGEQLLWLERLQSEHENLRGALDWALACGEAEKGLRLAGNLALFWYFRGYWSEGRDWLNRVLAGQVAAKRQRGERARRRLLLARARALYGAGWLADESGREEPFYRESLEVCRQAGDRWGEAFSLRGLGVFAGNRDQYPAATELLEQSKDLFRQLEDPWGIALALFNLGWFASNQNEQPQATAFWEESLALFRRAGDRWGEAVVLDALSYAARLLNDDRLAAKRSKESLALFRELQDKAGIATSLSRLGVVAFRRDEYQQANALFEESLALQRELGYKWDAANSLRMLGQVACYQGDYARAARMLEESLASFRRIDSPYGVAWTLAGIGLLAWQQGEVGRAAQALEESRAYFRGEKEIRGLGFTLYCLGNVRRIRGEYALARELLEESLAAYQELGEKGNVAAALNGLGRVCEGLGETQQAEERYAEALVLCQESGARRGAAESLENLARLALAQGNPEWTARLLGAAGLLREKTGAPLPAVERASQEATEAEARRALGEEAFSEHWRSGAASPWEAARDFVRSRADG